jgi:plasmid maintenance system antidote protein VapI
MTIDDELRRAIRKCGMTHNSIALAAGVPERTLSRFVSGERDIYMRSVSKIAAYFGMKLTAPKKPRRLTKPKG